MIQLNEKQKRILFNGRTLNSEFRRGLWKKEEFINFSGKKPILPMNDYISFLWASGCVNFYIKEENNNKIIVINDDVLLSEDIKAIVEIIKTINNIEREEKASLGKQARASRESDCLSRLVF